MGDCVSNGGIFNNYAVVQGADTVLPVDIYVAGCPLRPEALLHGILTLHERVRSGL
jgi:NADH-quinone oxidoreductase subunit B